MDILTKEKRLVLPCHAVAFKPSLTSELSKTDSKSTFLNSLHPSDAAQLINDFNDNELKEWEAGVEKGVKERDWTDLIAHRTYDFTLRDWMVVSRYQKRN